MPSSFDIKVEICKSCDRYTTCPDLFNSNCGVFKSIIKDAQQEEKKEKENVVQFPVDMDEMQKNILIELLNARKECTEQNLLTAHGFVAIIDALFYLIKEKPEIRDESGKSVSWRNAVCGIAGNYCSRCKEGPCNNRRYIN